MLVGDGCGEKTEVAASLGVNFVSGKEIPDSGRRQKPGSQASGGAPGTRKSPSRLAPNIILLKPVSVETNTRQTDTHGGTGLRNRHRHAAPTWVRFNGGGAAGKVQVCETQEGGRRREGKKGPGLVEAGFLM